MIEQKKTINEIRKYTMIIPKNTKNQTITKLNSLLKYYLIKTFKSFGYDVNNTAKNLTRAKQAKMILATIKKIHQNKNIDKKKLEKLFDMYKTYHPLSGGL